MPKPPKVAIATTLRDAGAMLDSFVAYHLGIGFSHLFLFFDDPADPGLQRFASHPNVTAIAHDDHLRALWAGLPEYRAGHEFADREVMARQVFNAALAMDLARQKGCDWLLHIDADELFFCTHPIGGGAFFGDGRADGRYRPLPEFRSLARGSRYRRSVPRGDLVQGAAGIVGRGSHGGMPRLACGDAPDTAAALSLLPQRQVRGAAERIGVTP